MTNDGKLKIKEALESYVASYSSQNKASKSLRGVSSATITQVLNENWELISDNMWNSLGSQVNVKSSDWVAVETNNFKELNAILSDAQTYANTFAITAEPGSGKTFTAKTYVAERRNAFLLSCNEYFNRKLFLAELLRCMGCDSSGYNVGEMMCEIVRQLKRVDHPVLILDEADKLRDQILYFFVTLYNQLEGSCGIVLMATDFLEKRIRRGLVLNKKGYKEIYSRIGRKFIQLDGINSNDIVSICVANKIKDKKTIKGVISESDYDLRRVQRKIHAIKRSTND